MLCEPEVAENVPPLMNPSLVPPLLEKEIVKAQLAFMVNDVVVPVEPVVGEGEQPFTA